MRLILQDMGQDASVYDLISSLLRRANVADFTLYQDGGKTYLEYSTHRELLDVKAILQEAGVAS